MRLKRGSCRLDDVLMKSFWSQADEAVASAMEEFELQVQLLQLQP